MEEPYIKEPINKAFANTDLIDIGSLNEGTTGIVQKAFAEWNKYMFCYYPANKKIIPSAYTVRNMNIPDTITNTQDNAFLNNLIEKRKLAKMFNAIDNGCESVSEILYSMNNKDLNRIKVVLVEHKRTNKWLAEQLGKDPATVSKWCTDTSQPSIDMFFRIAKLLNVDYTELIIKPKE